MQKLTQITKNKQLMTILAIVIVTVSGLLIVSNLNVLDTITTNLQPANNQEFVSGSEIDAYAAITSETYDIDRVRLYLFNGLSWDIIIEQDNINYMYWEGRMSIGNPPDGSYGVKLEFWLVGFPDDVVIKANTFYVGDRPTVSSVGSELISRVSGFELLLIPVTLLLLNKRKKDNDRQNIR